MLKEEFDNRLADINAYYRILEFIDKIESYKKGEHIENIIDGTKLTIDSDMQKCMRANTIILLYNLVESTFRNCIYHIYDAVHDNVLCYKDLSDDLRKVWLELKFKNEMGIKKVRDLAKEISDNISAANVIYDKIPKGTSGNLELVVMIEISKKFGINFGKIPCKKDVENSLCFIKLQRNNLAHGNCTFSSIGSLVTYDELVRHKSNIVRFLRHIIKIFDEYVTSGRFRK